MNQLSTKPDVKVSNFGGRSRASSSDQREVPTDANLTQAFKSLRKHHPAFQAAGHRSQDITTMLNGLSSILDAMNPIRNRASVAHPNEELLDELDARFVLNACKRFFSTSMPR